MDNLEVHLTVTVLESGIIIYRLGTFNFATVEAWITQGLADDQVALAQGLPRCSLIDISQAGYPTPYFLRRVTEATKLTPPGLPEAFAVVTANSGVLALIPHLMTLLPIKYQQDTRFFAANQQAEAITWLEARYRQFAEDSTSSPSSA
jgi:hypothetical protein